MFSPKAMVSFEPYMTNAIGTFASQMNSLIDTGRAGRYLSMADGDPEIAARRNKGEAALDVAQWAAFLAFDIISDLVSALHNSRQRKRRYIADCWTRLLETHSGSPR